MSSLQPDTAPPPNSDIPKTQQPETQQPEAEKAALDREDRFRRWKKARAPRMTQIVPGLVLGTIESSWNRQLLRENKIDAVVSLAMLGGVFGAGSERKAYLNPVTSGFSV
ncbi:hypothetical protein BDW62DRAFT_205989 [Aspergillus aurantiobrunneus]